MTGALCVYLQVKEVIWNWPIGIANNIVYFVVFTGEAKIYADACLQIFSQRIYLWLVEMAVRRSSARQAAREAQPRGASA